MDNINLGVAVTKINHRNAYHKHLIMLPEPNFYRELSTIGLAYNINVFVFSIDDLSLTEGNLYGYIYHKDGWVRKKVSFPDIIYNRCFYSNMNEKQKMERIYSYLRNVHPFQFINNSLPNKLQVYEQLHQVNELSPYFPHSEPLITLSDIVKWLTRYPQGVILKPVSGMQGKGILHIHYSEHDQNYYIKGRSYKNESIELKFSHELYLLKWIFKFKRDVSYLIQPYYVLRNQMNQPFDLRVLYQKDSLGKWKQTGIIARVGEQNGLTSNLHGGGSSTLPLPLLAQNLGSEKAEHLLEKIHIISGKTAIAIEEHFGRFGEIAFDFGVTPEGKLWLLECNSKPGRQAFSLSTTEAQAILAVERPIQYSKYLVKRYSYRQHAVM